MSSCGHVAVVLQRYMASCDASAIAASQRTIVPLFLPRSEKAPLSTLDSVTFTLGRHGDVSYHYPDGPVPGVLSTRPRQPRGRHTEAEPWEGAHPTRRGGAAWPGPHTRTVAVQMRYHQRVGRPMDATPRPTSHLQARRERTDSHGTSHLPGPHLAPRCVERGVRGISALSAGPGPGRRVRDTLVSACGPTDRLR